MHVVFFSDAHIRSVDDPQTNLLIEWLDSLTVDRVYILGDLFDYWWGYHDYVPENIKPLIDCFSRITDRGIELYLLGGNRDFALGNIFPKRVGATIIKPGRVVMDGIHFWLAHGDEADQRFDYRATRTVLRSTFFALMMRVLGPTKGYALLQRLARGSRQHMKPKEPLVLAQEKWAAKRLDDDVDVVVMGHSHQLAKVNLNNGVLYQIGDWISLYSYLELKDGKLQLERFIARSNEDREGLQVDSRPHR